MPKMKQIAIAENRFATKFLLENGTQFVRLKRVSTETGLRFPKRYREACYLSGGSVIAVILMLKSEYPGESLADLKHRMDTMATKEERYLKPTGLENSYPWAIEVLRNNRPARKAQQAA